MMMAVVVILAVADAVASAVEEGVAVCVTKIYPPPAALVAAAEANVAPYGTMIAVIVAVVLPTTVGVAVIVAVTVAVFDGV
jgi:hypothetical protein